MWLCTIAITLAVFQYCIAVESTWTFLATSAFSTVSTDHHLKKTSRGELYLLDRNGTKFALTGTNNHITIFYEAPCGKKSCVGDTRHAVCFSGELCYFSNKDGDWSPEETIKLKDTIDNTTQHLTFTPYANDATGWEDMVTVDAGCDRAKGDKIVVPQLKEQPLPYRFGLGMLTVDDISQLHMWQQWFNDAAQWSQRMFDQRAGPYAFLNSLPEADIHKYANNTNLLNFKLHVGDINASVATFPAIFRENKIEWVPNGWGAINGVMHAIFKHLLNDPTVVNGAIVTGSDIPMKPFSVIYTQYMSNPRSHIPFWFMPLPLDYDKHYQFIVLNRLHMEALVQNGWLWTCNNWLEVSTTASDHKSHLPIAGPDEYLPYHALKIIFGHTSIQRQVNDGKVHRLTMHSNDTHYIDNPKVDEKFAHTWNPWKKWKCVEIGGTCHLSPSGSGVFDDFQLSRFLAVMRQYKHTWFLRKVLDETTVKVNGDSVANYINRVKANDQKMFEANKKYLLNVIGPVLLKAVAEEISEENPYIPQINWSRMDTGFLVDEELA